MSRIVAVVLAGALLLAGAFLWWRRAPEPPPPPPLAASFPASFYGEPGERIDGPDVLLISVDTLRADHLSLYGYERPTSPNLDRYFADATVYERAYSTEANTTPSVVSMLSGLYPNRHRVRLLYQRLGPEVILLSDRLRKAGYQTAAVVSNMVLTAEASGLSTRFGHYDDFVAEREQRRSVFERRAADTTDAAIAWLEGERAGERPHLLWVHYIDPHGPYDPPPDATVDFSHEEPVPIDLERMMGYQRIDGLTDGAEYLDRYDEEIAYVDREIGRLLDAYDRLGLWGEAISVLTADHGETMMEHERYFTHGYHVWEPILRVPLAVRRPGEPARRVEHPVSLVDLTPTLLEWVGLDVPAGMDGRPLAQRAPGQVLSMEASFLTIQHRALLVDDAKWYATIDPRGEVRERWFADLGSDPGELSRRPWPEGEAADLLERLIETDPDPGGRPPQYLAGEKLDAPKVAVENVPPEDIERLRALGYVN